MGLPVALFVIIVLALVVAAMAEMQRSSGEMVSLQIQSQRAFFAAESGAQKVLHDLLPPTGTAAACTSPQYHATFTAAGLGGCSVTVSCSSVTIASTTYYT